MSLCLRHFFSYFVVIMLRRVAMFATSLVKYRDINFIARGQICRRIVLFGPTLFKSLFKCIK